MKFRRRFRMPYVMHLEVLEDADAGKCSLDAGRPDAIGRGGAPSSLPILGALRYIGRG